MKEKIIILDYGMGNLFSVSKKFYKLGVPVAISSDPGTIYQADKLIIPGVGHFQKAVESLKLLKLWDPLNDAVLNKKTPVLGICLGMQLMAKTSEEGHVAGLGWIDANVVRFRITDKLKHKVPHMGWNNLKMNKSSGLFSDIGPGAKFYFVHSYHMQSDNDKEVLAYTSYEYDFISAVEKDNIYGMQFHPEKSHGDGETLLLNFAKL